MTRARRPDRSAAFGAHSEKNKVTQYGVEKADGGAFFGFEGELRGVK